MQSDRSDSTPRRIQRKRTKGWRMPEGAVYVGRPTKWGNPFTDGDVYMKGADGTTRIINTVAEYRAYLARWKPEHKREIVKDLRGKNLSCWCQLDQLCHADVLLEIANVG